jgi:hypothetical protein
MPERRVNPRRSVDLLFNKYIHGQPYLCRAVDISTGGLLAVTHTEPDQQPESFPVELCFPGNTSSTWLWVRTVRRDATRHAMEFRGIGATERHWLNRQLPPPSTC